MVRGELYVETKWSLWEKKFFGTLCRILVEVHSGLLTDAFLSTTSGNNPVGQHCWEKHLSCALMQPLAVSVAAESMHSLLGFGFFRY